MTQANLPQLKIDSIISLYTRGEFENALDEISKLIKDYPEESFLFNINGACYQGLGDLNSAVTNFKRAIEINSDYSKAHYNLAGTFFELGKLSMSIFILSLLQYEFSLLYSPSVILKTSLSIFKSCGILNSLFVEV